MEHTFIGKWITDETFCSLKPKSSYHFGYGSIIHDLPPDPNRNSHIIYRKKFNIEKTSDNAEIFISADDYYKLYINGEFVAQGPTPAYHFRYNYNRIDVSRYLKKGENTVAVHTLYQGLVNRVWQSADNRHGLILDLFVGTELVLSSDESFKVKRHTAYTETGVVGYFTQFLESYDSRSGEVGFEKANFDDSTWQYAKARINPDYTLWEQTSKMLVFEKIMPVKTTICGRKILYDFGKTYVGYLCATAFGSSGDIITVRCGQELNDDGSIRYNLRANCVYDEEWILKSGESTLDWYDYKSVRYVELTLPEGVEMGDVFFNARHYPFELSAKLRDEYANDIDMRRIWELCIGTQKYGVQEFIQDCMEREKGFYLGDGCYTSLTNLILTGDDSMSRRLIDDAFASDFITGTPLCCINCSLLQEFTEYPLILVYLVLWHYNLTGDTEYLACNYPKVTKFLEAYRSKYEKQYLLRDLDKPCVVEWPKEFRHGYEANVSLTDGSICHEAHISLNAYYIEAVRTANRIADILCLEPYRDEAPLLEAFVETFYIKEKKLFRDAENTNHISLVGNSFAYGFGLFPEYDDKSTFLGLLDKNGIESLSFFCTFPLMTGFIRNGRYDLVKAALQNEGTWKRMLREDATTTFEGWGKDLKKNCSLFHLTMSYAATFMADIDLEKLFAL